MLHAQGRRQFTVRFLFTRWDEGKGRMETKSNGQGNGQAKSIQADRHTAGGSPLSPFELAAWHKHHLMRSRWYLDHCERHRRAAHRFDPPGTGCVLPGHPERELAGIYAGLKPRFPYTRKPATPNNG
jgi:hypothetical protein